MPEPVVADLKKLDLETRLKIVQELWDSIVDDEDHGTQLPLTAAERTLLDERLAEDDADPDDVVPWAEVRAELRRGR